MAKQLVAYRRRLIQLCTALLYNGNLAGFTTGRIWQGPSKTVCVPGLNCYSCPGALGACPLGALQSTWAGTALRLPGYVLGLLLVFAVLLGRIICGFLCPFGLVQELLHRLPVKKIPKGSWSSRLSSLKYVIGVVFVILLPAAYYLGTGVGAPAFCKLICPAGTLEAGLPLTLLNKGLREGLGWLFVWKLSMLIAVLVASMAIFRPFCRFICPLGVFYGLFNRLSYFGMRVDADRCTSCGACTRFCKMDIKQVGDRECIACGECTGICPEKAISLGKK